MNQNMIRNANVEVREQKSKDGSQAVITVNGEYQHVFPATSRISESLDLLTEAQVAEKLTGGSFFFLDDQLIDFRDGMYHGFVHEDASLDSLMRVIGFTEVEDSRRSLHRMRNRTSSNDITLSKVWNDQQIVVPHYETGGDFSSQLSFVWNPFQKNIGTKFELVRQICTNGMVGLTPFINMSIPLVNRWEEHLAIANMQLQNKIHSIMNNRLAEMTMGRSSVSDVMILDKHITQRLSKTDSMDERQRLSSIHRVLDPFKHLAGSYKGEVFENKAMAAQLPSHLTVFDTWNIATEVSTHTKQCDNSSDAGLQKLANDLVFSRECTATRVDHIGRNIKQSPFSSPTIAFFGEVAPQ